MRGQDVGHPKSRRPLRLGKIFLLMGFIGSFSPGRISLLHSQQSTPVFSEDFEQGLNHQWTERKLAGRSTRYEVVQDGRNAALLGRSNASASLLGRELDIDQADIGQISWRWKIESTISGNRREREKSGDDYAARLFVVFDPEGFGPDAEAICYVWAASESVGAAYPNPYFGRVGTIVVESGSQRVGEWVAEQRDLVLDHWRIFGKPPETISAVAIMVDTDNTNSIATAWFDDIALTSGIGR